MPQQEIICTVLPNGFKDGAPETLKLSMFFSPRLRFDGSQERDGELDETLAVFRDFRDWPALLASGGLAIDLIVDDDVAHPKPAVIITETPRDSDLWTAIFTSNTVVVSHKPGFEVNEPISTYPPGVIANGITEGYSKLGPKSPYLLADDTSIAEAFAPIHRAMMRVAEPGTVRARDVQSIAEPELEAEHRLVSTTLLRHSAGLSFNEKLAAATAIARRRSQARKRNGKGAVPLILDGSDQASAFAQFAAFHRREASLNSAAARRRDTLPPEPAKEFHEMLSSLGEYPGLLQRLGLVIDLEVAASEIPESRRGAVRRLRAKASLAGTSPSNRFKTPNTHYLFSRTGDGALPVPIFCAAPKGSDRPPNPIEDDKFEIVGGLLNLRLLRDDDPLGQTPQFSLLQVDLDGAGLKLLNALDAIVANSGDSAQPLDRANAGAPTLRTSGLSLVRAKFAQGVDEAIQRAAELETQLGDGVEVDDGSAVMLWAEDLVRGYRIDVRRFEPDFNFGSPGATAAVPWHSLHKREAHFTFPRAGSPDLTRTIIDEGFIQPALAQDVDSEPERDGGQLREERARPLYISQSMFHWQGWSLSAPPPTTPMDTSPFMSGPKLPTGHRPTARFEPVEKSLPRLRFGHYYQLRARTVDLAGNGLTVEQANGILQALEQAQREQPIFPPAAKDFFFRRFDPIPPPALVLREELTEGEAPDVLVIRSDEGLSAEAYAATLGSPKYKGVSERHVVPPKAAQRMTEMHGTYEGAFGEAGNPAKFYAICAKENGTLNDTHVVNVTTGELEPLQDLIDPHTGNRIPFGLKFVDVPAEEADKYAIHYEAQLRLPYLPDPLARGAALFGLPGTKGKTGRFDDQIGELSYTGSQLLPTKAHKALGFVTKIGFGRDWPGRLPFRLQLSDASADSQPLPKWDSGARLLKVQLPPGETATVYISCYPSKADLDLFGLYFWWDEHVGSTGETKEFLNTAEHGALSMLSPAHKVLLVHAVQKPVRLARPSPTSTLDIRRFPGDTATYFGGSFQIHGPSTAKVDLWAEWEEPGERGGRPTEAHVHVLELPIHPNGVSEADAALAEEKPIATYEASPAKSFRFQAPPNAAVSGKYRAKQDFGDTKFRKVRYTLIATSRYPEYFPKSITSEVKNITRSITLDEIILSSAPPAAPEVVGVVPILSREEVFDISDLIESRRGGGLRVFLGPTWYSSGAEEKLALVGPIRWGVDPIHSFVAEEGGTRLEPTAAGVAGTGPAIHPYIVDYDERRQSYFADVTFDAGRADERHSPYFPFVELTLARYQPNALPGMHLSPRVNAGIYQLPPTRWVELSYPLAEEGDPGRRINIAVVGRRPSAASHPPLSRGYRIEVTLEERLRGEGDDDKDLRWSPANTGQPIPDATPLPETLWSGQVFAPSPDEKERRIVIREFELFPINVDPPGQAWIGQAEIDATTGFSRRLVYADTILLP